MSDFWSRRREGVAGEAAQVDAAETARTEAESLAEIEALPEAEQLERLGLPDPDGVRSGDDLGAFLTRAVPRAIRNRALRALWRSDPVLANLDGLNDYDADYRGDGLGGGALKTSYEVGRGLARHVERMARAAVQPDENPGVTVPQGLVQKDLAPEPDLMERSADGEDGEEAVPPQVTTPEAARAPRMRFTFEEDRDE